MQHELLARQLSVFRAWKAARFFDVLGNPARLAT
jgi:hypothetical protein